MNKESATLIAAVIAAIASLANVLVGTWGPFALENQKWKQAREDDAAKRLNETVAGFSHELSTAVQRATWLTWQAENDPQNLTQDELDIYNSEIREIYPRLVSAQVLVAAQDRGIYERTNDLVTRFSTLDNEIARAASKFRESPEEAIAALRNCYPEAQRLIASLPEEYARIVGKQESSASHTR